MKKVLVIILLLSVLLISGCNKDYEKIFADLKNIELTECFSNDEEKVEFLNKVQENYNNKNYLTFEKESYEVKYSEDDSSKIVELIETNLVIKYKKEDNKLSYKLKQTNEYNYKESYTKKYEYIRYYDGKIIYCNDYYNDTKFSYSVHEEANYYSIMYSNTNNKIKSDYFLNFLSYENIQKFGKDKNENVVIIRSWNTKEGQEVYEKFVFTEEVFIEYEFISFEDNKIQKYVIEKYSYEENDLKYPNFKNYKYVGKY